MSSSSENFATPSRSEQLQQLNKFRRSQPHVSASALSSVLKEVAEHGMPELHSREHMHEAVADLTGAVTPHGKLMHPLTLQLKDGGSVDTWAVNPFAFFVSCNKAGRGIP